MIAHNGAAAVIPRSLPFWTQILFVVNLRSLDIQVVQPRDEEDHASGYIHCEILQELLLARG
jgi:hypothetical protein